MATKQVSPVDFIGNVSKNCSRWKELMDLVLARRKRPSFSSVLANKAETLPEPGYRL